MATTRYPPRPERGSAIDPAMLPLDGGRSSVTHLTFGVVVSRGVAGARPAAARVAAPNCPGAAPWGQDGPPYAGGGPRLAAGRGREPFHPAEYRPALRSSLDGPSGQEGWA